MKFVCPRGCGTVRMLNRGVQLALCSKCQTMMVSEWEWKKTKSTSSKTL